MRITDSKYVTSAVGIEGMLITDTPQIAIAGRSNVGKSSFINFITNNSKLCRTSSEPGRTRMVNYFEINKGDFYFVDLPGYGYAKAASDEDRNKWAGFIDAYLSNTINIANVFVLVDLRHPPSELDIKMINYLNALCLPFTVIGTKADKIGSIKLSKHINMVAQGLRIGRDNIVTTSSLKKTGSDKVLERIESIINGYNEQELIEEQEIIEE